MQDEIMKQHIVSVLANIEGTINILVDGKEDLAADKMSKMMNKISLFIKLLDPETDKDAYSVLYQSLKKISQAKADIVSSHKQIISYRKMLGVKDKLVRFCIDKKLSDIESGENNEDN